MKVRLYLLKILMLVFLVFFGCRRESPEGVSSQAGYEPGEDSLVNPDWLFESADQDGVGVASEDTLVIGLNSNPGTLNPLFVGTSADFIVVDVLYKNLFFLTRT